MRRRPGLSQIVTYRCESCWATESRIAGSATDGMCGRCNSPMRIDALFSDRRIVEVPVIEDRRVDAAA